MLTDNQATQVKNILQEDHWGWRVEYAPKYEDFLIRTDYEVVMHTFLGFLVKREKVAHPVVIKKEDINWNKTILTSTSIFWYGERQINVYVYFDHKNKILLFR